MREKLVLILKANHLFVRANVMSFQGIHEFPLSFHEEASDTNGVSKFP